MNLSQSVIRSTEHWSLLTPGWVNQDRGLLRYPVTLYVRGSALEGANQTQVTSRVGDADYHEQCGLHTHMQLLWAGFTACMGLLGPVIQFLHMEIKGGKVITSKSLGSLWTCANLRRLTLESLDIEIEADHLEAGLQHLRSAALTPRTLSHHLGNMHSE